MFHTKAMQVEGSIRLLSNYYQVRQLRKITQENISGVLLKVTGGTKHVMDRSRKISFCYNMS